MIYIIAFILLLQLPLISYIKFAPKGSKKVVKTSWLVCLFSSLVGSGLLCDFNYFEFNGTTFFALLSAIGGAFYISLSEATKHPNKWLSRFTLVISVLLSFILSVIISSLSYVSEMFSKGLIVPNLTLGQWVFLIALLISLFISNYTKR